MTPLDDRPAPPPAGPLARSLLLLRLIAADGGGRAIAAIASEAEIPLATAYRLVAELVDHALVIPVERGRYMAGPGLIEIAGRVHPAEILARLAQPMVAGIARRFRQDAHLAVMEGGMVTYLVKAGAGKAAGFARQGMQLEAYCSGVGKVLLAHLPTAELAEYLANGPFIRLTANTIVEPDALRRHLEAVRERGWAIDDEEIAEGLKCLAVPVLNHHGEVIAALSVSGRAGWLAPARMIAVREALESVAAQLHAALSGRRR